MPRMPKTRKPLEKEIEKKICDYARSLGCKADKFTSPNRRSVPDRIVIAPGGAVGFLEIKRGGESPTKAQDHEIGLLKALGCVAQWCDNVADGKLFVDYLVEKGKQNKMEKEFWG